MGNRSNIPGYWQRFLLKLKHWEFWPTALIYLPVLICYPFWAIRARSIFFFAAVNPKMTMGGLYGASKYDALMELDAQDIPTTLLFQTDDPIAHVLQCVKDAKLEFPLIVKPDLGERGKGVEKVNNLKQLEESIASQTSAFLLQEYIDLPFEAGVFYIRRPGESKGKITSIVVKGFLTVTGDGHSTIEELALLDKRAVLIWDNLLQSIGDKKDEILAKGVELTLEPIGNHSRGTAFNDGNHLTSEALEVATERLAQSIPSFYYGRFDVRAASESNFRAGKTIKVMEVNGANAEPAHIYQEGASLLKGLSTLLWYWKTLAQIARTNQKNHPLPKFSEALVVYRNWQNIKKEKWNAPMEDVGTKLVQQ